MAVTKRLITATSLLLLMSASSQARDWFPYDVEKVDPPFSADGKRTLVSYIPLAKASKAWNICVSFPHMKDAYWLGVDYGVADEAKRLGIKANIVEAGGYTELSKQMSQIEDCATSGADAIIISAISFGGLNNVVSEVVKKGIPVIDLGNGMSSSEISAKSLVSFYSMGAETGSYLAKLHPKGGAEVEVGWFPGPAGAGWVEAANKGFLEAAKGSALKVLEPKFGDTGKEAQLRLVEDALEAHPNMQIIAGTAVTVEAAEGLLRERGLSGKINLLSFYMTPEVYDGIKRGAVLAAPADSMVIQGRIAVDQAVRILEHKDFIKHAGPKILVVDKSNISEVTSTNILPPDGFKAIFNVQ